MVERRGGGQRRLWCLIDPLFHSALWSFITWTEALTTYTHTHGHWRTYTQMHKCTHTKTLPLSLWPFIFRKSTPLAMFHTLHPQASESLCRHTHKHTRVISNKSLSQDICCFTTLMETSFYLRPEKALEPRRTRQRNWCLQFLKLSTAALIKCSVWRRTWIVNDQR